MPPSRGGRATSTCTHRYSASGSCTRSRGTGRTTRRHCENGLWLDSQKLCHEVLAARQPRLDVAYAEVPGYGHLDMFIGRGAALDVFGHILDFLGRRR